MDVERKLYNLGIPLDRRGFFLVVVVLTAITAFASYHFLGSPLLGIFVPIVLLALLDYLHTSYVRSVEEELPRFIHYVSTHPSLTLRDVIRLGSSGFGNLSKELRSVQKKVEEGLPPGRALRSLSKRLGSPLVERVVDGLLAAFRSGSIGGYLKNLSEELYFVLELENERRSAISLQRYSILVSSTLLVPFILGLVVSVVERIGRPDPVLLSSILPYLVLLASISGLFLAWTEGKPKNAPFYILVSAAVSVAVYTVVLWLY